MIAEVIPRSLRYCGLEEGVMIWLIVAVLPLDLDLVGEVFRRGLSADHLGIHCRVTGSHPSCGPRTLREPQPLHLRAVGLELRCFVDRVR